jgi:hypothetical protein
MPGGYVAPIDYGINVDNPTQAFTQGVQAGSATQDAVIKQQQMQMQLRMQAQMNHDTAIAAQNPTPEAIASLSIKYPALASNFKQSYDMLTQTQQDAKLNSAIPVYAAAQAGNYKAAADALNKQAEGYDNAGKPDQAAAARAMAKLAIDNPQHFIVAMGTSLAGAVGKDKFVETFTGVNTARREQELQPGKVAEGTANASKAMAEASNMPTKLGLENKNVASQIDERNQKLGVDVSRLKLDEEFKRQELAEKYGQPQGENLKLVNDAVTSAAQNNAVANRFKDFATKYETVNGSGLSGWQAAGIDHIPATWQEGYKYATGQKDAVSNLRNEYDILKTQMLTANLPPQVTRLTDSDLKVFNAGLPDANAPPTQAAQMLRSMSVVKHLLATTDDLKASWSAANRSLAEARNDFDVHGVKVAKGTSFNKFLDDYLTRDAQEYKQSMVNDRAANSLYAPYGGKR